MIIVGDFNICLLGMDRPSKQKISTGIAELNSTINELDIMDIYGLFHVITVEYTLFPSSHGAVIKIDHFLGYKTL